MPARFDASVQWLLGGMLANTGWLYLLVVFVTLVFMFYLAFSRLGELLTLFYLSDEHEAIASRVADDGVDSATASRAVLGLSFDQLGVEVAGGDPGVQVVGLEARVGGQPGREVEHLHERDRERGDRRAAGERDHRHARQLAAREHEPQARQRRRDQRQERDPAQRGVLVLGHGSPTT